MEIAENISKKNDYGRLSVISGVGVREYYEKL
jgi:histone acetyltransferase (RNA polymerase elongator complex component)